MVTPEKIATNDKPEFESVVFKGYKSGITLIIPETGPFEKYFEELKNHLRQSQDFFRGAKVRLEIGKRVLQEEEFSSLIQLIGESGLSVQFFSDEPSFTGNGKNENSTDDSDYFIPTITVKKTVRSGQRIEYEGNLMIMGDVNPGAEVVATGDIVILGTLRGIAHAGAQGDQSARIIALQFKPVQIRIGGVITRAPEKDRQSRRAGPEVAMIKEGRIVVERF